MARLELDPRIIVVGQFAGFDELCRAGSGQSGDVLLCTYGLSETEVDGVAMIRRLRSTCPAQSVLVLTPVASAGLIAMAMEAGAAGVVSSRRPWADVIGAIVAVAAGQATILGDLASLARTSRRRSEPSEPLQILDHPWLSAQEREVLRCCLTGLSVSDTARKLGRSAHTISTQKRSAYNKLKIESDFQLFALIRSV